MAKADLSADRLRELLDYNPDTGIFTWRGGVKRTKAGQIAGATQTNRWGQQRRKITIGQQSYMAHRLAWLYVYGMWPDKEIDHVNGDPLDNRISNLRNVDRKTNMENIRRKPAHNKSGFLGVTLHKVSGKYMARVSVDNKLGHYSYHNTPEEAHEAYIQAKRRLHEGCTI